MSRLAIASIFLLAVTLACAMPVSTVTPAQTAAPVETNTKSPVVLQSTGAPTATSESQMAIVKAAAINVRQKPDGEVIAILNAGNTVRVVKCLGNWCQIEKPFDGWVWRGCLRELAKGLGCQAK